VKGASGGASRRRSSVKNYFALILLLEFFMIGVFTAADVFLFYVFFEAMLVPMYFIIGSFGGPRRQYAAMKFFLYSLVGGLLMLASVIGVYVSSGTSSFAFGDLVGHVPQGATGKWLFLGFFIAFAIKAPLVPFHTWLPDAGAEAPRAARRCSSASSTRWAPSASCATACHCSRPRRAPSRCRS